ncbi:MAG: dihydrolipoyl dehydrogenase family protein [Thermodesulfobacteriota bacterium]
MEKYDLVIIGGGVGGLVSASGAAQLGARVAMVEKEKTLGGDCLHWGCVPTKRLVHSAKVAMITRRAGEFGVGCGPVTVDFPEVMASMKRVQAKIALNDDPERFRKMGVDVIFGSGAFEDDHTFNVDGRRLVGKKFLLATGSSPAVLPIPGLKEVGALTNITALELTRLPASIIILGGGPIGIEFAQIFSRLGAVVTILEKKGQILPREDKELSEALHALLVEEGIKIVACKGFTEIKGRAGAKAVVADCGGNEKTFLAEEIMSAIGRTPNVEGLGLDAAGVEYDKRKGVKSDLSMKTTQAHIYAAGDVTGPFKFTHMAEYQAGLVVSNALFPLVKRKADYRVTPWVTFADPELARVGLTEAEARAKYDKVSVYRQPFSGVDRALLEGEGKGLIKIVVGKKKEILGAHILGPGAGELIHEYVLAMKAKLPVTAISGTIHVYPTVAQGLKRACDAYYTEKLFSGWFPKISRWLIRRGS